MTTKEIRVPDIGDFADVPVVAVFVKPGDTVAPDDPLVELESDKATMEVPAPMGGTVREVRLKEGDKVTEGSVILVLEVDAAAGDAPEKPAGGRADDKAEERGSGGSGAGGGGSRGGGSGGGSGGSGSGGGSGGSGAGGSGSAGGRAGGGGSGGGSGGSGSGGGSGGGGAAGRSQPDGEQRPKPAAPDRGDIHAELLVLGSGPGGYSAAFRAADLGLKVVLVERYRALGGVCLNVGCIPSKALLHAAKVIAETEDMADHGIRFARPEVDLDTLRGWKDGVVGKLTGGLSGLAKGRKVQVATGRGSFTGPHMLSVEGADGTKTVSFDQAVIAAGSEPVKLPFVPHDDSRVIDSTGALELENIPKRLLVIGGGIIGLEMATVYEALGSKITVVELMDQIIPGADPDIVKPLHKRIAPRYEAIHLKARVTAVEALETGLKVSVEGPDGAFDDVYDKVLVAVGRRPNGKGIGLDAAGVKVDERGFVAVDDQQRTNVGHIFAIGDVVGQPMLAHKAVHEGKVAAEVAAGRNRAFEAKVIPSVAYTDPEVAWCGLTETEAKAKGVRVGKGVFPWAASGRSLALGRDEGVTKLLFDHETDRVVGAGIVGPNAGDLIAEVALAIEMGADATDLGHTIHPHPTLSETVNFAAEMFEGTITDLMPPKKK